MDLLLQGGPRQRYRPMTLLLAVAMLGASALSSAAPAPKIYTVVIEALQFSPANLEVNAGDTVIWKNKDPFPHNATAENKAFSSRDIPGGQSWKFKAGKKGVFPYVCTLHPGMKAVLTVK